MSFTTVVNIKKKYLAERGFRNFDHWNDDPHHIYIGRSMTWVKGCTTARKSKWANPFSAKEHGRDECIEMYKKYISNTSLYNDLEELMNKELGCWCTPEPCHGNVLVMLLEEKLAQLQNKY